MAHDVLIAGALFPDVPSVQFPDSQQQWHSFTDVSDTTAAAADVASGKQFYDAAGTLTQGTASGGGGSSADLKGLIERTVTTLTLPSDLTSIGQYAFRGCTNLALTSLPSGVTSIGAQAFYGCTNLALTSLPSEMTSIGTYVFYDCTNLALTSLPSSLTTIEAYAFYQCSTLAFTTLPDRLTSIGQDAFKGCRGLTSISSNASLTITGGAFNGNSSHPMALTEARFPKLASQLVAAFGSTTAANACQHLTALDAGLVTTVKANALANCYALQTLVLRYNGVCSLANTSAFTNTPMNGYGGLTGTVYVPSSLISSYKTATNWKTLFNNGTVTFSAIQNSAWEL